MGTMDTKIGWWWCACYEQLQICVNAMPFYPLQGVCPHQGRRWQNKTYVASIWDNLDRLIFCILIINHFEEMEADSVLYFLKTWYNFSWNYKRQPGLQHPSRKNHVLGWLWNLSVFISILDHHWCLMSTYYLMCHSVLGVEDTYVNKATAPILEEPTVQWRR